MLGAMVARGDINTGDQMRVGFKLWGFVCLLASVASFASLAAPNAMIVAGVWVVAATVSLAADRIIAHVDKASEQASQDARAATAQITGMIKGAATGDKTLLS